MAYSPLARLSPLALFLAPALAFALAPPAAAQTAAAQTVATRMVGSPRPVDRIVAVVDEDPIFFSDLQRALAFGFARPGAESGDFRPVLDQIVDERLRAHDIDRYGVPPAPEAEIDAQLDRIEKAHGGAAALDAELAVLGSNREELRRSIDLQLRILVYIDERLAPRVFVDDEELSTYYEGELAQEMARQGQARPAIGEVREGIRSVLRERKLNQEAARWTKELRESARITDLLAVSPKDREELPPVVLLIGPKR